MNQTAFLKNSQSIESFIINTVPKNLNFTSNQSVFSFSFLLFFIFSFSFLFIPFSAAEISDTGSPIPTTAVLTNIAEQMQTDEFNKSFPNIYGSDGPVLYSENIYVRIYENGSADIVSFRKCLMTRGTENFIPIGNLGASVISNFSVSEYGKDFEYVSNWNINASREQKTNKCGIVETADGYELCWGIGDYGKHNYKISYHVSDFVKETKDAQIIFWKFINNDTNLAPKKAKVVIWAPWELGFRDNRIWSFGYEGTIKFVNGCVVAESSFPLLEKDYVTVLVEMPKGSTSTKDVLSQSMDDIIEKAFEGSDYTDPKSVDIITKMAVNVTIDKNASAHFNETIEAVLSSDKPIKIPLLYTENTTVTDIHISESGTVYKQIDFNDMQNGNINESEPFFYIKPVYGDRYDIVFFGKTGAGIYNVSYSVTDFVKNSKDGQIIDWYFQKPTETAVRSLVIRMEYPKGFQSESKILSSMHTDILYETNGFTLRNKYVLPKKESVNDETDFSYLAVSFPPNTFQTGSYVDEDIESIYSKRKEATVQEETTFHDRISDIMSNIFDYFITFLIFALFFIVVPFVLLYNIYIQFKKKSKLRPYMSSAVSEKFIGQYIRTFPYSGNETDLFYLLAYVSDYATPSTYIAYCLLKWMHEGKIEAVKGIDKTLLRTKDVTNFKIINYDSPTNPVELKFFKIFSSLEKNGIVLRKDLANSGKTNHSSIENFLQNLEKQTKKTAQDMDLIENTYAFKKYHKFSVPTEKGRDLLFNVQMFKNFLLDFSLLSEREEQAVFLWGKYMIWAGLLGIADKVLIQIQSINPQEQPSYIRTMDVNDAVVISSIGSYVIKSYNAETSRLNASSSGGGGFSSSGGGGGSFGGGGGGGYR